MAHRGAGCWEIRLSGSRRGRSTTKTMEQILWHRRETRRLTLNTNLFLQSWESPVYSNMVLERLARRVAASFKRQLFPSNFSRCA